MRLAALLCRYALDLGSRRLVLDRNNHQGWYGECFVQALAAAAGYMTMVPRPDQGGTDLMVMGSDEIEEDFPLIKIQVKSWSTPQGDTNYWHYRRLNEKQFNILAGKRQTPIYLALVLVPRDIAYYTSAGDDSHVLRHAAYWMSLADRAKIPNPSASRTVSLAVPRANRLTADSIRALCEASVRGRQKATTAVSNAS